MVEFPSRSPIRELNSVQKQTAEIDKPVAQQKEHSDNRGNSVDISDHNSAQRNQASQDNNSFNSIFKTFTTS